MAIYPPSPYESRKSHLMRLIATIAVLITAAVVIALIYYRTRGTDEEPVVPVVTVSPRVLPARVVPGPNEPNQGATAPAVTAPIVSTPIASAPAAVPIATAEPNIDPNDVVGRRIAEATLLLAQQPAKIIEARDRLNELLPLCSTELQRASVRQRLGELAEQWLFSSKVFPDDKLCAVHKVQPGDLLVSIGKQYNVPYEILMQINRIDRPESLQAGVNLKVINGPFHARVSRSTFTLDLYLQNTYVKSFSVGLGKTGMETPTGTWRVKSDGKLIKPAWTNPQTGRKYEPEDADYPLGSRWIALEGIDGAAVGRTGFAIHGTKSPEEIGAAESQGCIRLHNGDAILVYNLLMPGQSLVKVVD